MNQAKGRQEWLQTVKRGIVELAIERQSRLVDICPSRYTEKEQPERTEALKGIAFVSKEIDKAVQNLLDIEKDTAFGFAAILGRQPTPLEAVSLSLLLAARLEAELRHQIRTVGDVVSLVSVRDPETAVAARSLYRADGSLYPHCWLSHSATLDDFGCRMTEQALNKALGLPPDLTEVLAEVQAVGGRFR